MLIQIVALHPVHVSLLDDRRESLLGGPSRLQERGQVGPLPQLRDRKLEAKALQRPLPDGAPEILAQGGRKDGAEVA